MGEPVQNSGASTLTELELQILEFERQWWRYPGSKEAAIRELFSISTPRYYQLLNALLDNSAAETAYPTLVRRLRRLRESRTQARSPIAPLHLWRQPSPISVWPTHPSCRRLCVSTLPMRVTAKSCKCA